MNPALYDMQAGLQWVQANINAFGGDKTKVTGEPDQSFEFDCVLSCVDSVYGQSAGAISIGSLLLADGGQAVSNLNLFRAAILESGAPQG